MVKNDSTIYLLNAVLILCDGDSFSSRRIMWAYNNVIIVGESIAREYVGAKTGIEALPGLALNNLFLYSDLPAVAVGTEMLEVYKEFLHDAMEPFLSAFRLKDRVIPEGQEEEHGGERQVELAGGAVFKGDHI